jgi:hypothetical protein
MGCPCRAPAAIEVWESGGVAGKRAGKLFLCPVHARAWLCSAEKRRCVDGETGDFLPESAAGAISDFCERIWRELPMRTRLWWRVRDWLDGVKGRRP